MDLRKINVNKIFWSFCIGLYVIINIEIWKYNIYLTFD